jgi:hypothetical protein
MLGLIDAELAAAGECLLDGVSPIRDGDHCYYADENAISPLWKGRRFPLSACISGWVMLNKMPAHDAAIHGSLIPKVNMRGESMRFVGFVAAAVVAALSGAAWAQAWDVYTNRENFFTVNLPGAPVATDAPYRTAKGANLTAHVFTATAPSTSILAGTYKVTVIDYSSATDEIPMAVEHAAKAVIARGTVKYDGLNNLDLHLSRRLTVETAMTRILAEILVADSNRLYVTEAETPLNVPPAANFQASLQILDAKGVRIRERTARGFEAGVASPIGAGGVPDESNTVAAMVVGAWRTAGGACETAYFKSGTRTKTTRGEEGMTGTITNAGTTISGQLVLNGARAGQFINPVTDRVIMLFDPQENKLGISAIGEPALGWPDVALELCPGSRG